MNKPITDKECGKLLKKLVVEPFSTYHKGRDECVGSHGLANFGHCPLKYHLEETGEIERSESEGFAEGRAVHTLTLEGRKKFDTEYKVDAGPINESTGKCYGPTSKKYLDWLELQSEAVMNHEQYDRINNMRDAVHAHPIAGQLLSKGVAERVGRAHYEGVRCQIRIDWLTPEFYKGLCLVDLKTTADLDRFVWDARKFKYSNQAAFYRGVLHEIHPSIPLLPFCFIAVEKVEPYRVGVWEVDERILFIKEQENKKYLKQLTECREKDRWPTLFEDIRKIETIF